MDNKQVFYEHLISVWVRSFLGDIVYVRFWVRALRYFSEITQHCKQWMGFMGSFFFCWGGGALIGGIPLLEHLETILDEDTILMYVVHMCGKFS